MARSLAVAIADVVLFPHGQGHVTRIDRQVGVAGVGQSVRRMLMSSNWMPLWLAIRPLITMQDLTP